MLELPEGLVQLVGQWLSNSFLLPPTIRQTLYVEMQYTHKQEHTRKVETDGFPQNIYYYVLCTLVFSTLCYFIKNQNTLIPQSP